MLNFGDIGVKEFIESKYIGTYALNEGFSVDIFECADCYEAWLYHKDCGIKTSMTGVPQYTANIEGYINSSTDEGLIKDDRKDTKKST